MLPTTGLLAVATGPPNPWFSWAWVSDNTAELWAALQQHVLITGGAVLLAILIGLPLALLASRVPLTEGPILGLMGILYTIPSLALIGALIPVFGLSPWSVVVALAVYALLVIVRNVVVGLAGVPADVLDAADGMGLGNVRRLVRVELPLALPAIIAGVRLAVVSTIGLLTVGGFVGYGGFGNLIYTGFQRTTGRAQVVTATLCCVALALVADALLVLLQRLATPWARRSA